VLLDQRSEATQQPGSLGGCDRAPGGEGRACALDCVVSLVDAGRLELGDLLLGRGVDDGQVTP
jgi:hypothetical protein